MIDHNLLNFIDKRIQTAILINYQDIYEIKKLGTPR